MIAAVARVHIHVVHVTPVFPVVVDADVSVNAPIDVAVRSPVQVVVEPPAAGIETIHRGAGTSSSHLVAPATARTGDSPVETATASTSDNQLGC